MIDYAQFIHPPSFIDPASSGRGPREELDGEPASLRLRAEVRRYGFRPVARLLGVSERWLRDHINGMPPELEDAILAEKASRGQR